MRMEIPANDLHFAAQSRQADSAMDLSPDTEYGNSLCALEEYPLGAAYETHQKAEQPLCALGGVHAAGRGLDMRGQPSTEGAQPPAIVLQAELFRLVNRRGEPLHLTSPSSIPLNARSKGSNSTRLWTDKGRLVEVLPPSDDEEILAGYLISPGEQQSSRWIPLQSYAHATNGARPGHQHPQCILDLARNRDLVAAFDTANDGVSGYRITVLARRRDGRRTFYVSDETLSFRLGK